MRLLPWHALLNRETEQHRSNQDPEPYHSLKSSRMPPFRHHCDVVGEFRFEHSLRHVNWRMSITGITAARRSLALPLCSLSDLNDRQLLADCCLKPTSSLGRQRSFLENVTCNTRNSCNTPLRVLLRTMLQPYKPFKIMYLYLFVTPVTLVT